MDVPKLRTMAKWYIASHTVQRIHDGALSSAQIKPDYQGHVQKSREVKKESMEAFPLSSIGSWKRSDWQNRDSQVGLSLIHIASK